MIIQTTGSSMMTAAKNKTSRNSRHRRRLVIVVRADPVICGHSGEARNLAEVALQRGFTDVRILTWPLDLLTMSGLPLKPLEGVLPYSKGIEVERPEPVGDYKVLDGRHLAGMTGRLVELFTDGVPTVCMSLYLSPHTLAVADALRVARSTGLPVPVLTIAEAVGSDVMKAPAWTRRAPEADSPVAPHRRISVEHTALSRTRNGGHADLTTRRCGATAHALITAS